MKRSFAERARRGKKDGLLVSFGEHGTSAGSKGISNLLSKHRGFHVMEVSGGLSAKEAREAAKKTGKLTKELLERHFRSERSFIQEYLFSVADFYKRKSGKAGYAEVYRERELRKLKKLVANEEVQSALATTSLMRRNLESALTHYNNYLDAFAELEKFRGSVIVRNLSRMKGNILARYGMGHSVLFSDLMRLRPDARIVFEEKPIFSYFNSLAIAKLLGKAKNPPREILLKAWIEETSLNALVSMGKNLGVSANNPKLTLFFRALLAKIPEKNLEDLAFMRNTWYELCRLNGLPDNLLEFKPNDQLGIIRVFSAKVYGEHSKLFRTAYPAV